MSETEPSTAELLARLEAPGDARLAAISALARRSEPAAARPLIKLLRAGLSPAEDDAILGALERVGTRAILPLLRHTARARPELAGRLDALHALLRRPPPPTREAPGVRWVDVGGGRLAVGHRPKLKAIAALRDAGATHLVTLLSEAEGARALADAATAAGLAWLWLPLPNGDPPGQAKLPAVLAALAAWTELLAGGAALYIHCAAGIHRTGMITQALLRRVGCSPEAARRLLAELRPLTAAEVGEARLAWGDRLVF